ncbi:MAG TPA: hypothetical protein VGG61_14220, partial [Gemmataceae bacterium]
ILLALAWTVQVQEKDGGDREALSLIDRALKVLPYNYILLREKTMLAITLSDRKALSEVIAVYRFLAPTWTWDLATETRQQLELFDREAKGPWRADFQDSAVLLNNLLMADPWYDRDRNEADPRDSYIGKPVARFLRLEPLQPEASPPDHELQFEAAKLQDKPADAISDRKWDVAIPIWLSRDAKPTIFVADAREVREVSKNGTTLPFPGGPKPLPPSVHGVLAVDLDNDFRTDFVFAGAGGLRFFLQGPNGEFTDVTAETGLDPAIVDADYFGVWAVEFTMSGDLDLVVAPRTGAPFVLKNNRDGTFNVERPFTELDGVRAFVWADLKQSGFPNAVFLDAKGKLHYFANKRHGLFREQPLPENLGRFVALAVGDLGSGAFEIIALREEGALQGLAFNSKTKAWHIEEIARWPDFPSGAEPGPYHIVLADLDNNGALDLIASGSAGTRIWLGAERGGFTALSSSATVFGAAPLHEDGRLDLLALSKEGLPTELINHGKERYHWLDLRLRAAADEDGKVLPLVRHRINSFALGGEIECRAGLWAQKQIIADAIVHIGLGTHSQLDLLDIDWPNRLHRAERGLKSGQNLEITQPIPW